MALSIRDPETGRLARELADLTGETMTEAIRKALAERLARARGEAASERQRRRRDLEAILAQAHALPVLDPRSADEILGYDERGLPT